MRTPVRFMKRKSKATERGGHSKRYVRKRIDNKSNKKIGISALICGALAIAGFCGGIFARALSESELPDIGTSAEVIQNYTVWPNFADTFEGGGGSYDHPSTWLTERSDGMNHHMVAGTNLPAYCIEQGVKEGNGNRDVRNLVGQTTAMRDNNVDYPFTWTAEDVDICALIQEWGFQYPFGDTGINLEKRRYMNTQGYIWAYCRSRGGGLYR